MDIQLGPGLTPTLRKVLWADAAVELVIALLLTGIAGRVHRWLNMDRPVTVVAALVFAAAAVAVAVMARHRRTSDALVRQLAIANIGGGVIAWAVTLLGWGHFESEGRWLLGATADSFIVLGVLELLALRQGPARD